MSTPIHIVVFDWGNVLLRIVRDFSEACTRANLPLRGDPASAASQSRRQSISRQFQIGKITAAKFSGDISAAVGGLYQPKEFQCIHDAWLIEEFPGVSTLIDDIHAAGRATTGLLSNTNEGHWLRHIGCCKTPADFPAVAKLRHKHASHLLGLAKPHAEIFQAFERASGFRSNQILFFDDLEENIRAAQVCGWQAYQVNPTPDPVIQMRLVLVEHHVI